MLGSRGLCSDKLALAQDDLDWHRCDDTILKWGHHIMIWCYSLYPWSLSLLLPHLLARSVRTGWHNSTYVGPCKALFWFLSVLNSVSFEETLIKTPPKKTTHCLKNVVFCGMNKYSIHISQRSASFQSHGFICLFSMGHYFLCFLSVKKKARTFASLKCLYHSWP